ncbi:hypothetical protein DXG03_009038 [Asterophora parasitica]|uniref:Uncharacterized protein n=1 Tax=Asterophora parasitica TaxID=117018 RepID=A0A9P7KCG9_9AGAR|nr:hypothetical protein DXG03_009038 [Asterophora parasitica]
MATSDNDDAYVIPPMLPLVGTPNYPRDAVMSLARVIIKTLETEEKMDAFDDSDHIAISKVHALIQTVWHFRTSNLEPKHYNNEGCEQLLLDSGSVYLNMPRMMDEAIKLRREVRGSAPPEDERWRKEDALLDFLWFVSRDGQHGFFKVAEDEQ